MLQARTTCVIALLGLFTGVAANAGDYYSSPQVRLGVDVVWGGYAPAPAPPVAWYPAYAQPYPVHYAPYPVHYAPYPAYYRPYPVYNQHRGHSRHKKHRRHHRRHDD